jgi:alkylated DNA nucleotide flippase Atl1
MDDPVAARTAAVLAAIRAVPRGQVAGYGEIARRAGLPGRARLVARLLADNEDLTLPWHRVLRSDGRIAFPAGLRAIASNAGGCAPRAWTCARTGAAHAAPGRTRPRCGLVGAGRLKAGSREPVAPVHGAGLPGNRPCRPVPRRMPSATGKARGPSRFGSGCGPDAIMAASFTAGVCMFQRIPLPRVHC